MPTKIPSCRHALQKNNEKLRRTRRINRPFTPFPRAYLLTIPRTLQAALVFLWEHRGGNPCSVSFRLLSAKLRVHPRTAQAYIYRLEKLGELGVTRRRVSRRRNADNVYTFPKLRGFITEEYGEITVEKPVQILKANTPPRGAREGNESPAMRKLFERNAELLRRLRKRESRETWMLERARERTHRAMQACVGVPRGPFVPPTAEQEREWKDMYDRELQKSRELRETREKAMLERSKVCGYCGGRGFNARLGNRCNCAAGQELSFERGRNSVGMTA